jgi:HD superfamily phosphohydrolase
MVTYNDPVHGSRWQLTPLELAFVNHPALLQLRGKAQLGLSDFVFTSGSHSRYTHSVGVGLSARRLGESLGLSKEDLAVLQAAAFLHDIGHAPFSHAVEAALGVHHESISQRVLRGEDYGAIDAQAVLATLHEFNIDPLAVADTLAGKTHLSQFIAHDVIDADRMDYLARDLIACNVGHNLDLSWLYAKLMLIDGKLGVKRWAVRELEQFMVTRARAYDVIYYHPVKASGELLLREAIRADPLFTKGTSGRATDAFAQAVHAMSDTELLARLTTSKSERTQALAELVSAGPSAWWHAVHWLGGPNDVAQLARIMPRLGELKEALAKEGMLCTVTKWNEHWVTKEKPPVFPVEDGSNLWDYPIARAAWENVPDRVLLVFAPKKTRAHETKAREIIARFAAE